MRAFDRVKNMCKATIFEDDNMTILRVMVGFITSVMLLGTDVVSGQTYPSKPIHIVTSGAGGSSDFTARLIAQGISGTLGQSVIVDNRAGIISYGMVAKAPPDGYNVLLAGAYFTTLTLLQNVPADPVKDFSPVTQTDRVPSILAVHPSLPVKSPKELIVLAKAKPGALNYGSSPAGTASHLGGELFKSMAGINIVRVTYKSAGLALNALMGGEVELMMTPPAASGPHIRSNRLRALAVTTAQPTALAPGLPTMAASGIPGFEMAIIAGVYAPAKTPEAIINRLNEAIVRVLKQPDIKQKFFDTGVEIVASSPGEHQAAVKADIARWAKVIKDAGIRAE